LKTNIHNQHLNIITVYRPVKTNGIHTCYQQQCEILKSKGILHPDPRKQLLSDLEKLISQFNRQKDNTIVMMDANEGLFSQNSKISTFLAETQMIPLINNSQHYPPTHKRGSQCIDFIFGSQYLQDHITASGISPYYEPPYPLSDHRGLFIDINILGLFGASLHTPIPQIPKRLSSLSKPMILKFINKLEKSNSLPQLYEQFQQLTQVNKWEHKHHEALEMIDTIFTKTLLEAEEHSALPSNHPWSPALDNASLLYTYWLIVVNGTTSKIDTSQQLETINLKLKDIDIFQNDQHRRPLAQMPIARRHLINCQLESRQKRDNYLTIQNDILIEQGKMTQANAIRQKINREHQRRCWQLLRTIIHGSKTAEGISHVLLPNANDPNSTETPTRIQIKHVLDPLLLDRNISHFSQAHITPFTTQPILQLFGHNGCTQAAIDAINGKIPINITKHSKLLLQHMQRIRDPIPLNMTFTDMCNGFSKWREKTTTSPSNKHLGIYKSLLNAIKYKLYTDKETINQIEYSNTTNQTNSQQHHLPIAELALQIQYHLMTLAIKHCQTYGRWQIVHNFLIEKTPGLPLITKLRVIQIYEADWSLIQRFYVAHKLTSVATLKGTTTTEQAGGRPGRSSIELAINRVITYETIRLQRLIGAVLYNDAKACYDRIIENISNMSLLREGLPIEIAQLHAQTFNTIQYYIKHKQGIGPIPHSNNNPAPIYGVGQGSTDASARWSFLSDAIIRAFSQHATDAIINSPITNKFTNSKIAGFVDDTTSLLIQHITMLPYIILILQQDAQLWEKLLFTTGGKLEIQKCVFAIFKWKFDNLGRPVLQPSNNQQLHVKSSETGDIMLVPQIEPSDAYIYVGVQLALDGNMTTQIATLKTKCNTINGALSQVYMSARDTKQGYTTVFVPSIRYILPSSSITQNILQKIQSPIIDTVLTKLGFNRHMPRSVVFAPTTLGGIGQLDLFTEQGCSKIITIISHI
jgi:hypothetical protein